MVVVRRSRKATGPDRPRYLGEADVDRLMAIVLALAAEVATLRERIDTHERIDCIASPMLVEAYQPDAQTEFTRELWRDAYIQRLFRVILEDVQSGGATSDQKADA